MNKLSRILSLVFTVLLFSAVFTSCVDQEYDDIVTANVDPDLTPTHTLKQLQYFATGPVGVEITTDVIVAGIVVGDDRTGNIYKKLILQEDSFGISVQLDISDYYTEYPVGRHVYIKCKGLYIANNEGNIELGSSATNPVGRITRELATQYLVKGKWGLNVDPMIFTLADAEGDPTSIPTNTLVKFNDVEFEAGANGGAYAATSPANLILEDCALPAHNLILYSSNYSTFAFAKTPYGKGSIVGVYTIYSGDGELQIRDTTDVHMNDLRCDGSTGVPSLTTLDSVRALDPGAPNLIYLPGDRKIEVVVTSNFATNMLGGNGRNIYVQDATGGIQIRFTAAHSFAMGTKLEINISGKELSTFSGVLQINNVSLGSAIPIGSGTVTPRITTIADINANYDAWESQVVQIDSVIITGTGVFGGTNYMNGDTTVVLYAPTYSSFANDSTPVNSVSVTGILSEFNGKKEVLLRSPLDVQ